MDIRTPATAITPMSDEADITAYVAKKLAQLTRYEKASLLSGRDAWRTVPIPRVEIPALAVTDGPHGARSWDRAEGHLMGPSTAFPTGSGMAATWNPLLIEDAARVIGQETAALGIDILLGPCVNIVRTPLAGRNYETFSEDPFLAGELGVAYVRGLQREGVGACVKHYACNNQETGRTWANAVVDERTLREIYLAQFERIITQAKPWMVMAAYNRINGAYACQQHHLLVDILREEWGFENVVVSDWLANHSVVESVLTGLDLEMPGPGLWRHACLLDDAVATLQLREADLDRCVARLLRVIAVSGRHRRPRPAGAINQPAHHALARRVAEESMTLLKNTAGLLPLRPAPGLRVAVIGPTARNLPMTGGGSAAVYPPYLVTPWEALQAKMPGVELLYAHGCDNDTELHDLGTQQLRPPSPEYEAGLLAEYYNNNTFEGAPVCTRIEKRMGCGPTTAPLAPGVDAQCYAIRWRGKLAVGAGGRYQLHVKVVGAFTLALDGRVLLTNPRTPASSDAPPVATETVIELTLATGREYPLRMEFLRAPHEAEAQLSLRYGRVSDDATQVQLIEEAVDVAQRADVALVCVGNAEEIHESECWDRLDLLLPLQQNALVAAVAAANPRTVVVVTAGAPIAMPWLDQVQAVLFTYYAGQEGSRALAEILTGEVNPSGKLPCTFPCQLSDNPTAGTFPGDRNVNYEEGIFVGYRHYDAREIAPLFPFGHGLSYTTFRYSDLLVPERVEPGSDFTVAVTITNTGAVAGHETVQLYISDAEASVPRPPRELKAFQKIALCPGESTQVTLRLDPRALAFYDVESQRWVAEAGVFLVQLGSSSRDMRVSAPFTLTATWTSSVDGYSPIHSDNIESDPPSNPSTGKETGSSGCRSASV